MLGISWDDVDAKYRTLVPHCGLSLQAVDESLAMIHEFVRARDVKRLVTALLVQQDGNA